MIKDNVILITGAGRGIGSALVVACIEKGAKKIYATDLKMELLTPLCQQFPDWVIPVLVDVTSGESVAACAALCSDVGMVINNAGVEFKIPFMAEKSTHAALFEMKVNYIGVLEMMHHFVPVLERAKEAAIVNILSIGSLVIVKRLGSYCASKAATHILTETVRDELALKNIKVMAAYMGYVNTQMSPDKTTTPKSDPNDIAFAICNGIDNKEDHIFPDEITADFVNRHPMRTHFME